MNSIAQRAKSLNTLFDEYDKEYVAAILRRDFEAAEAWRKLKLQTMAKLLMVVRDEQAVKAPGE